MKNRRVFIAWSGADNREIAGLLSEQLKNEGYSAVVGGEWKSSLSVSEDIIHQMNGCDFGIFLITKETRRQGSEIVSIGFNPNVMMELGYMLHKVGDHNRIRRFLINVSPNELPSDLQGTWTDEASRLEYPANDSEARRAALQATADEIGGKFLEYMSCLRGTDKLDYFDNWEENKLDIFNFTGDVRIGEMLIYGMQAAIYWNDFDRLFNQLLRVKDELMKQDRFNDYGAVACAIAVLKVFVVTRRLNEALTEMQFGELCEALEQEYEKDIADADLKNWCSIFRKDKLELCHEFHAKQVTDPKEKADIYNEALRLCHETLEMLEKVTDSGRDEMYASIYKAFANRNISQIHKSLIELEPEKAAEHCEMQKKYCCETYKLRKALYDHYKSGTRENSQTMDFISQEYYLALSEQYEFEQDAAEKRKIKYIGKAIRDKLEDRARIQSMILQTVKTKNADFLND